MGWREALKELTRTKQPETGETGKAPVTGAKGGGNINATAGLMNKKARNRSQLEQYRTIYENGGIVSQGIDAYALYTLMNGWHLEGEEARFEDIETFLDEIGFDDLVWQSVVDSLVFGDALQEIQLTRGGDVFDIQPRAPECFDIKYDPAGTIVRYEFYKSGGGTGGGNKPDATLEPLDIVHVALLTSSARPTGDSLVARCFDDITRDTIVMEGAANALKRHAWPKFHIKAGTPDQPITDQATIDSLESEFQKMDSKTEYVTSGNIDIIGLDATYTTGLALDSYNNVVVSRLCASLGVPMEVLGLRQGTTDNTAVSRQESFYKRIQTFQKRIARVYNQQLIDRITGKPGSVWLVFNKANQPSELEVVQKYKLFAEMDSLNGDLYVREAYNALEMDTSALDEAQEEQEVEVPVQADAMLDPFKAQQEKMKAAALPDAMVDDGK